VIYDQAHFLDRGQSAAADAGGAGQLRRNPGRTRSPIIFEASNSPGQLIGQGTVKPAGEPDAKVAILINRAEARKMAFAMLEYLQAYAVVQMLHPLQPGHLASHPERH